MKKNIIIGLLVAALILTGSYTMVLVNHNNQENEIKASEKQEQIIDNQEEGNKDDSKDKEETNNDNENKEETNNNDANQNNNQEVKQQKYNNQQSNNQNNTNQQNNSQQKGTCLPTDVHYCMYCGLDSLNGNIPVYYVEAVHGYVCDTCLTRLMHDAYDRGEM